MSQAVIGNLRATLGLDSAQFESGARKAQGTLAGLKKHIFGFAAGVTSALSLSAVAGVLQSSIDKMDELGKAAQKIGIPVEELSKLEYAARLSDVSLGDLQTSLGRFSKSLSDIAAGGKNDAGNALKALGISALDADGKLKPTSQLLLELSDKFASARDGANKTALAMALFGKSGADMIPFLNQGSAAIREAYNEAQVFGITVSGTAAAAAEEFNDNLTRLQSAGQGVVNVVAAELLPTMSDLSSQMVETAKSTDLAASASDAAKVVLIELVRFAIEARQALFEVATVWDVLRQNWENSDGPSAAINRWRSAFDDIGKKADETKAKIDQLTGINDPTGSLASIDRLVAQRSAPGKGNLEKPAQTIDLPPIASGGARKEIDETAKALERLRAEGKRVWEDTRTPAEQFRIEMERLKNLLDKGAIDLPTYTRAVADLKAQMPGASGAVEKYQQTVRELNDLLSAGAIDQGDYNRAIAEAQSQFDGASKAAENLGETVGNQLSSTFESWIDSAIDGTFDLKDALASLAKDVAKMFIHSGLQGLFGGGTAGGGLFGGLFSSLFGGFAGLYAGGGNIPSGKWGVVGEAGYPEIVSGPGTVTPMKDLAMGGGHQTVDVVLHPSRELWAEVDQKVAQGERRAVQVSVSESVRQANRNFASTYRDNQIRRF